jgi:hypothetical protein
MIRYEVTVDKRGVCKHCGEQILHVAFHNLGWFHDLPKMPSTCPDKRSRLAKMFTFRKWNFAEPK